MVVVAASKKKKKRKFPSPLRGPFSSPTQSGQKRKKWHQSFFLVGEKEGKVVANNIDSINQYNHCWKLCEEEFGLCICNRVSYNTIERSIPV